MVLFVTAETLLFVAVVVAFIEVGLFVTDASFCCCLPPFRELKTFGEEDGIVNVNVCGNSKKICLWAYQIEYCLILLVLPLEMG